MKRSANLSASFLNLGRSVYRKVFSSYGRSLTELQVENLLLYIDEHLLVTNKPAGLPTLVDGYHSEAPYLLGTLIQQFGKLWVVHRLDRDTSGVIVFARTAEAHRHLNAQFEHHTTEKIYHAIVCGVPEWHEKSIRQPLLPDGDRRHRTIIDHRRGKPALTELLVMERFQHNALIQAVPRTGRPHQIRAHLAAIGFPIACDTLYGGSPLLGIDRAALHAVTLRLTHPFTEEQLKFTAPYPSDFLETITKLQSDLD